MKDSLPIFQPPARSSIAVGCRCMVMSLLAFAIVGCSDSHSDDYVTFENLEGAEATEPSPEVSSPAEPELVEPVAERPKLPVEPASLVVSSDEDSRTAEDETVQSESTGDIQPGNDAAPDSVPASVEVTTPKPIKLLVPHRRFRKEGTALRATFDDIDLLKILNMEPVPLDAADHFPDWLKQLNGAQVRIRGYMRPGYSDEDITEFLFVRDNGECCYGPLPKIYDMIAVELAEGESTDLIDGTAFDVEGTFRIETFADDVELYGLFFIDDGVISE